MSATTAPSQAWVHGQFPPAKQVAKLAARIHTRGHITFGGRLTLDAKGFIARKMAKNRAGDWRDEADVKRWVESVVAELIAPGPAQQPRPQSNRRTSTEPPV